MNQETKIAFEERDFWYDLRDYFELGEVVGWNNYFNCCFLKEGQYYYVTGPILSLLLRLKK